MSNTMSDGILAPPKVIYPNKLALSRSIIIATIGFLTLVDLFAAQAILPSLVKVYGVSRAEIGVAANAGTMGMAVACLGAALFSRHIDRRLGICISLALLAVPTFLLSVAPSLSVFALLRVAQGLFMATAFTLTMAYLSEQLDANATASALAAYITGVVASNLIGRIISASVADMYGLATNFWLFAALNLAGALLVYLNLDRMSKAAEAKHAASPLASWGKHLRDRGLRAAFGIGFLILFAFIGTFTYVNFVLASEPLSVGAMAIGFAYLTFLPSMFTTPVAGRIAVRFGSRITIWMGLGIAGAGLPLLLIANVPAVLFGMVLISMGTFFAQAVATGFVGRAATTDRAAASGLYLASYYCGGLVGAVVLGQAYDRFGWPSCVAGIGLSLLIAAKLALHLRLNPGASDTPPVAQTFSLDVSCR